MYEPDNWVIIKLPDGAGAEVIKYEEWEKVK